MEEPVVGDCVEGFRELRSLSWGTVSKALENGGACRGGLCRRL